MCIKTVNICKETLLINYPSIANANNFTRYPLLTYVKCIFILINTSKNSLNLLNSFNSLNSNTSSIIMTIVKVTIRKHGARYRLANNRKVIAPYFLHLDSDQVFRILVKKKSAASTVSVCSYIIDCFPRA